MATKPKKSLSQFFLHNKDVTREIVQQLVDWKISQVLEIGPGRGALTIPLLQAGFQVTAVETDGDLVTDLIKKLSTEVASGKLRIAHHDYLQFDVRQWLETEFHSPEGRSSRRAIVGNLPYHLSTPILIKTLEFVDQLTGILFMVQKEYGERLVSGIGTKAYGSLSIYVQLRSEAKLLRRISKGSFFPRPKVDSALVTFTRRAAKPDASLLSELENITKFLFSRRRKTLGHSLRTLLPKPCLEEAPVALNLRPENISPEEYVTLAQFVCKNR